MSSPVAASNNNTGLIGRGGNAEFFDDFDEDDDVFFSQSQGAPTATNDNVQSSTSQQQSTTSNMSSFGMLALSYDDVTPILSSAAKRLGGGSRPTSPTSNFDNTTPQDNMFNTSQDALSGIDQDDIELQQLDKQYLSILRNPNSTYHSVAKVCLALHQLCNNSNNEKMSSISSTTNNCNNTSNSIQIVSSTPIIQIKSHQIKIHLILTSLTNCLSTHTLPSVRILSTSTLVTIAKSNYALLNYPHSINCTRMSSVNNAITNLQDDCGVTLAYTLVTATLEQQSDSVSCEALVSLGKFTLDTSSDSLLAEVRSIAECTSIGGFEYAESRASSVLDKGSNEEIMKDMSSRIYEFVIFPRMSSILHRVSLYTTSPSSNASSTTSIASSIAKTLPILTATIIHALTKGKDTIPSRRTIQSNKSTHGKRGWRENDAISIAKEYVANILLPLLDNCSGGCIVGYGGSGGSEKKTLQRAISVALIRMSNACPLAQWRVMACRYASTVLLQQLNSEMGSSSSSFTGRQASEKKASSKSDDLISSTLSSSMVPPETLAGTAALLVIALRGIPLNERTPGLTAVLRATLLHLPMGMSVSSRCESLDLPIASSDNNQHYRLGRTGLLTEVAVSVMLDGSTNVGTRSVLLQRILQSDQLSPIWDNSSSKESSPVNELLWVLCSVATQVDTKCEGQIGLVILDFFAGVVCNPTTRQGSKKSTSFTSASYSAYNTLFKAVLKRCGAFPPSALSISENMIPGNAGDKTSPTVVGGPGKQVHHDAASSLLKIATKIVFLRDKAKQNSSTISAATEGDLASLETSSHIVHLAALLVDTWLGCCIMNHDAKETNSKHLDMGLMFLPLCHAEVETLLKHHRSSTQDDSIVIATQLGQALIACLENVACMSELLAHTNDESIREENVGPLVISMLEEVISSAKEEIPTDSKRGSMLRYQIAMDANNAISRISKCIENLPKSYPEDIASAFQVSPLIGNANPKSLVSSPLEDNKSMDHCIQFMYNHARLVLSNRTNVASKAVAHSTAMSGVRRINSRNPLRLNSSFTRSTIEMYEKLPDLPILVPSRSSNITKNDAITLTGSSDPISLLLSHGMRRVRRGDSSECMVLIVTMRLFNITPVPIQNGVRLELRISQQSAPGQGLTYRSSSSCVATSLYNNEIKPGDFATWEVTLDGGAASTNLLLQPSVTFREVEQESTTHKWVSGAGGSIDVADDDEDDNNETTLNITLPCQSTSISPITSLLPCPLVFFAGFNRCEASVGRGDSVSFNLLWQGMKYQKTILLDMNDQDVITNGTAKRGYVLLGKDNQAKGYAFMVPNGCRIFCTLQASGGDVNTVYVRSDSSALLETLVGTESMRTTFLKFVFGETVSVATSSTNGGQSKSPGKLQQPDIGHDFPSLTMPGRTPVAV